MYEKNLQNQKVSSSIFYNSAQRQRQGESAQRDDDTKQSKTKIFKYPYLVERSNEKNREDKSQRSTQKQTTQTHHRRKIFEPKSSIDSEMKQSTLSADHLLRNQSPNVFQSNPVRQKIKNTRNKSIGNKKPEPALNTQPLYYQNSANLKYYSPHGQQIAPPSHFPALRPPMQEQTQKTQITLPQLSQNFAGYGDRNIPIGYYSVPLGVQNQRAPTLMGSSLIVRPQFERYQSPHPMMVSQQVTFPNQVFHPHPISDYTYKDQHASDRFKPIKITANSNILPQTKPTTEKPQIVPATKISWVPIQGENQHLSQQQHHKKQTHYHNPINHKGQSYQPHHNKLQNTQHHVNRNMYETYKIGERFKKHNFLQVPANQSSPNKTKSQKKHSQQPSTSSFASASNGQQEYSIDLHEVEELEDHYLEEVKYADRFYDMDFKETKKQDTLQNQQKNSRQLLNQESQNKDSLPEENISLKKMSSQRKEYEKKQTITRKSSITSIALEKESIKKLESEKEQKTSVIQTGKRENFMARLMVEGRFFTFLLIGIGILLVIVQILR